MSDTFWNVMFILMIVLFVACIVLLIVFKFLKNTYYHPFHDDELIKKVKTENSINCSYFTSGETQNYIKKYVICSTMFERFVVCNFTKSFKDIIFFVVQYNSKNKVCGIISCREVNTTDTSKIIAISPLTKKVNIVIGKVNNVTLNSNVIKPIAFRKIKYYSLINSVLVFSLFYITKDIIIKIVVGDYYIRVFNNNLFNYLIILLILILSLFSYLITYRTIRKKNVKSAKGGAIEYEFL